LNELSEVASEAASTSASLSRVCSKRSNFEDEMNSARSIAQWLMMTTIICLSAMVPAFVFSEANDMSFRSKSLFSFFKPAQHWIWDVVDDVADIYEPTTVMHIATASFMLMMLPLVLHYMFANKSSNHQLNSSALVFVVTAANPIFARVIEFALDNIVMQCSWGSEMLAAVLTMCFFIRMRDIYSAGHWYAGVHPRSFMTAGALFWAGFAVAECRRLMEAGNLFQCSI
jgi:hypothetical protein